MLSLLFVVLGAPDDAHSEVVVGAIALPVLYLVAIGKSRTDVPDRGGARTSTEGTEPMNGASRRSAGAAEAAEHEPGHRRWLGGGPDRGDRRGPGRRADRHPAGARAAARGRAARARRSRCRDGDITEPVNEVVYGTRGFDTFGETFLLLAAVISVVLITRPREPRRGYFGEDAAGAARAARDRPATAQADAEERAARPAERREQGEPARATGRAADPRRRPAGHARARRRARGDDRRGPHRDPDRRSRCSRSPGSTWSPGATRPAAGSRPAR